MPIMRLGPFVFSVPTFSYESLSRQVSGRVESQPVIGAAPTTHLLGPNGDTIDLSCTFYPFHLNGAGLLQLKALQAATRLQTPLMMVSISGLIFGRWVPVSVGENHSHMHPMAGTPQKVDVDISLQQYVGARGSGNFDIGVF